MTRRPGNAMRVSISHPVNHLSPPSVVLIGLAKVNTLGLISSTTSASVSDGPAIAKRPGDPSAHRADIDGLRAVAILSVLGFHASSDWLPGGFVGVDIFFVISGYLISGIILAGLHRGTFSFADFYARRVKRIFPALLVVLVVSLIFGWFSLFTDEYQMLGKHVASGASFVANIVFWRESGYFDPAGTLKPLLHLWSLGIEEQFYLIWPPMLCILSWRKIDPLPILVAITVGSFALNLDWIRQHEVRTFYLPVTRLWELSLGGILADVQISSGKYRKVLTAFDSPKLRSALAILGLCLLVVALVGLTKYQQFPGWRAAIPTFGSFLLIAAGNQTWINRVVLGNRVMVFVGLISYPLYLWHWPLLSFQRIVSGENLPVAQLLITLAVAFILAWLTYRIVERPIRASRKRLLPAVGLVAGVALTGAAGYLSFTQVVQPRSASYGLEKIITASSELAFPGPHLREINDSASKSDMEPARAQGTARQTVLFLGDSQAEQYYPRIDLLLTQDPLGTKSVVYSTIGGCPPIPGVRESHLPECDGLIERGIALAKAPNVDTVVLIADWMGYFVGPYVPEIFRYYYEVGSTKGVLTNAFGSEATNQAFLALQSMITLFVREHKTVIIVLPTPHGVIFRPRAMIARSLTDLSFRIRIPVVPTVAVVSRMSPVVAKLRQIAAETGAIVIDPVNWLCNDSTCPVMSAEGEPIYRDGGHLNPAYVKDEIFFLDDIVRLKSGSN